MSSTRRRRSARPHARAYSPTAPSRSTRTLTAESADEFDNLLIRQRFTIDTTNATVEESLQEFISKVDDYLTAEDRERMKVGAK